MGLDKSDVARTLNHLGAAATAFGPQAMAQMLKRVGDQDARLVDEAVTSTLGDLSMSHWSRRRPIPIRGRAKVQNLTATVSPTARGPMRVLESGRQGHAAGEGLLRFRKSKTKGLRVSHRIVGAKTGRGIGATRGKGTWTRASNAMVLTTTRELQRESVARFRKAFGGS